ncbi:MAG: ABC transporter ATP-binding protein [Tenericutes bacterium HGW-Tenericutes-2]|jgi:ABC-2 type transport system ATP-binding protein|nr:MAG: ABC transporter ATP-binding protein [Tenericutes bacterium HGW-Tenericutes-2]
MIEVKNLTKDFGFNRGVFDISFEVKKGEVYGFLGPNGAGKTTTIRMLMGFSQPGKGIATINNHDCWKNYYDILDEVGYIPGEVALPEGLSGLEFIEMMKKMKHADDSRISYLLDMFELNPDQSMRKMSIGDKRKLAIVSAFMSDPNILILDEPTSGLDPIMQNKFIELIKSEKQRGKTILLSTHIFEEVDACCDRLSIIKDGKIISTIDTDTIRNNENKVYKIEFLQDEDFNQFMKSNMNIVYSNKTKRKVRVAINDKEINRLIKTISAYQIKYFSESQFTLEDYFLKYYKDREGEQSL